MSRHLLGLLVALSLVPLAGAHGLISLNVVVPEACPGAQPCLSLGESQPSLHAGETVDVNVYNDDEAEHRVHVTTASQADRSNGTPTERALASSQRLPANSSQALGEVAVPADAEALYVWCSVDDHETEGEHLVSPLEAPHDPDNSEEVPLGVLAVLIAGVVAAFVSGSRE